MSVISIMPLDVKVKITKTFDLEYSQLLKSANNLKEADYLLGKKLILEEGCEVKFEGFKAFASDKSYPDVKLTVYPVEGKAGSLYVSFEKLEGLIWEPVDTKTEEPKKPFKQYNSYEVSFTLGDIKVEYVYHRTFNRTYHIGKDDFVLINPLELSQDERKNGFCVESNKDIGEALVKIGKTGFRHKYQILYQTKHYFTTKILEEGLLGANFVKEENSVILQSAYSSERYDLGTANDDTDFVLLVKSWLKEKYRNDNE